MPPMLAVVICINHVMLIKEFTLSGRKLKTATNKTLVRRFRRFSAQSCRLTLKLVPSVCSGWEDRRRNVSACFFFFFSPKESCQIRHTGDIAHFPLYGSIWRSGGVQASSCREALGIALFVSSNCDWRGLELNHCCDGRHPERMWLT